MSLCLSHVVDFPLYYFSLLPNTETPFFSCYHSLYDTISPVFVFIATISFRSAFFRCGTNGEEIYIEQICYYRCCCSWWQIYILFYFFRLFYLLFHGNTLTSLPFCHRLCLPIRLFLCIILFCFTHIQLFCKSTFCKTFSELKLNDYNSMWKT